MRDVVHGAVVDDVIAEEVAPYTAAQRELAEEVRVESRVEADVAKRRVEIRFLVVRVIVRGLDSVLLAARVIDAREIAELDALRQACNLVVTPAEPLGLCRDCIRLEIDQIATLRMRILKRRLLVE